MEGSTASRSSQDPKKDYFGRIKFVLKLVGVSLEGDESRVYQVYSFLLMIFINLLYMVLDCLEIFKYDVEAAVNMVVFPFSIILAFSKTIVFIRNRAKLGKLLDKLQRAPFVVNLDRGGEAEQKLMEDCRWIINAQCLTYWISGVVILIAAMLTIAKRFKSSDYHDWQFPFGPLTVLNVTYSPNYEISWAYQMLSCFVIAIQFTTYDVAISSVLVYVFFQFKILQNNIRRIMEISYVEMLKETEPIVSSATHNSGGLVKINSSIVPWKYLQKSLENAINYHLAILDIADEMEDLFSVLMLIVFLFTLGMLGLFSYLLTVTSNSLPIMMGSTIVTIVQVLLCCFWGEQVIHESQEVGRAAFQANFVGADLRFQKSLVLIIRRSQNPTVLTAGKFTVVCLSTFTWIVRASYSAFTVLQNVKQQDD